MCVCVCVCVCACACACVCVCVRVCVCVCVCVHCTWDTCAGKNDNDIRDHVISQLTLTTITINNATHEESNHH